MTPTRSRCCEKAHSVEESIRRRLVVSDQQVPGCGVLCCRCGRADDCAGMHGGVRRAGAVDRTVLPRRPQITVRAGDLDGWTDTRSTATVAMVRQDRRGATRSSSHCPIPQSWVEPAQHPAPASCSPCRCAQSVDGHVVDARTGAAGPHRPGGGRLTHQLENASEPALEGRSTTRGGEAPVDRTAVTAGAPPRASSAPASPVEAATAEQKQEHDDDQQQFHSPLSMMCGPAPCATDQHDIRPALSPDTDYAGR
jgi:hypothetical protein